MDIKAIVVFVELVKQNKVHGHADENPFAIGLKDYIVNNIKTIDADKNITEDVMYFIKTQTSSDQQMKMLTAAIQYNEPFAFKLLDKCNLWLFKETIIMLLTTHVPLFKQFINSANYSHGQFFDIFRTVCKSQIYNAEILKLLYDKSMPCNTMQHYEALWINTDNKDIVFWLFNTYEPILDHTWQSKSIAWLYANNYKYTDESFNKIDKTHYANLIRNAIHANNDNVICRHYDVLKPYISIDLVTRSINNVKLFKKLFETYFIELQLGSHTTLYQDLLCKTDLKPEIQEFLAAKLALPENANTMYKTIMYVVEQCSTDKFIRVMLILNPSQRICVELLKFITQYDYYDKARFIMMFKQIDLIEYLRHAGYAYKPYRINKIIKELKLKEAIESTVVDVPADIREMLRTAE